MKKLLTTAAVILSTLNAQAGDVFAWCVTEYPTTSFIVETEKDQVNLQLIHHNGLNYAPFWNSMIVTNDFAALKQKSDLVMKLEPVMNISWEKSGCKIVGPYQFVCLGTASKVKINGVDVEPFAVYSSHHKESSFAGNYEHVEVALRYYVNNEANEFVMKYQTYECTVSDKKINKKK